MTLITRSAVAGTFFTRHISFHTGARLSGLTVELERLINTSQIPERQIILHKRYLVVDTGNKVRIRRSNNIHLRKAVSSNELGK